MKTFLIVLITLLIAGAIGAVIYLLTKPAQHAVTQVTPATGPGTGILGLATSIFGLATTTVASNPGLVDGLLGTDSGY